MRPLKCGTEATVEEIAGFGRQRCVTGQPLRS